ncbi:MAG TPA: RdgB/HAM1 family non-canonical purine NTP pyrophosphatase [Bryobacteraceae bacterium]|jgi:XTP/dITP diphosphohydrolase|nr:RdgB/HAM1 family non-canonical purine NTP pyrophosphatase [Bryobacteraceae bacterium]
MILYACSSNPGKLREFALAVASTVIQPLPRLRDIPAPDETGSTFEENARLKAVYYSAFTPELVFADDSGLEVDALAGAPGVHSARYAGPNATDAENNALLLEALANTARRSARFVCFLALARQGQVLRIFRGAVDGEILPAPRGAGGFGYDPLFFYPPFGCSFAELAPEQKFAVSHRGNALRALARYLSEEK